MKDLVLFIVDGDGRYWTRMPDGRTYYHRPYMAADPRFKTKEQIKADHGIVKKIRESAMNPPTDSIGG